GQGTRGPVGWPYVLTVWAYNLNDLAATKAGTRTPWSNRPYALWSFSLPYPNTDAKVRVMSSFYDRRTRRLHVMHLDQSQRMAMVVSVFQVTNAVAV
ncbi:MAG TPA: hypothetical protein VEA81_12775, partial [Burkholderiaceae bacterium]|nr:hypothetical protein [Burkholderiaceae bacterium]